jgi:hypothetical protein
VSAGEVEKATSESWNEYGIAIRCVLQSGYEPPIYAVSVSATAGGSVNTIGGAYNYGETIALAATPAPNHIFERWTTAGSVTVADAGSPLTTMTVNGPGIVTANFKSNSSPAMIIYWDSQTGTMQVGTWGIARQDNMLFFQFGSVVGFTNNNDGWGADKVKFNPPNGNYTTYGDIPRWNGTATTDGYISDPAYHNAANVQAGRGDPCKLVGFTAAEIAAGSYDNEQWRLPTEEENNADFGEGTTFVGDWGVAGHGIGKAGVCFLPAAGLRQQSNGSPSEVCQTGAYWTSKPEIGEFAQSLHFQEGNTLSPVYGLNPRYGLSVRCVPNDESPRQLIPRALILYFDADNLLSLGEWDNPAVNVSNMAFFKFGSVIGFHNRKTGDPNTGSVDWPGASAILFNPTKLVYGTDYADIPGYVSADYPKLVSSAEYATVANLMAGKGDPCMLVGYIGAQLQDMNENQLQAVLDNAAYRMPTNAENMEFAGTTELQSPFITHWTANDANATRPGVGKFPIVNNGIGTSYQHKLPAAGTRNHSTGAVVNQGLVAYYPSATPSDNNGYSYSLNFGATVVSPKNLAEYSIGTGIRCVLK